MPKIEVHQDLLESLLQESYTNEQLEDVLVVAKSELDDYDEKERIYKIELNDTNRPDLWSVAGVARQLKTYRTEKIKDYDFFSSKDKTQESGNRTLIVDKSAKVVRPFSIGFAAKGVVVDEHILLTLIQSQEKLCHNFGQKRKTIAIGVYRDDLIKYPVHFKGADPDKTKFIPLGMTENLSLKEICEKHPKGKEYGHIVADKPLYPLLFDDNGEVLSFPPVINSASWELLKWVMKISFEFSGTILDDLILAANIMA